MTHDLDIFMSGKMFCASLIDRVVTMEGGLNGKMLSKCIMGTVG